LEAGPGDSGHYACTLGRVGAASPGYENALPRAANYRAGGAQPRQGLFQPEGVKTSLRVSAPAGAPLVRVPRAGPGDVRIDQQRTRLEFERRREGPQPASRADRSARLLPSVAQPNIHSLLPAPSPRGTAGALPPAAISCLGAFRPPAASARGLAIIPAAENLYKSSCRWPATPPSINASHWGSRFATGSFVLLP
jgi:hypothetical protein